MCVYLSTRMCQKPRVQTSRNFLSMSPVAVAWSFSDDNALCYVLPGFVDDIMFSHSGA